MTTDALIEALKLGKVPDDELLGIFSAVFPLSRWESENRVAYFHPERGHALDVVYDKHGRIASLAPAPGLTEELVAELRELAEAAFANDAGFEVRREILFSTPEVKGYWRYRDEWQILPAPPGAPRPGFVIAEHPFMLEYRIRASANTIVALTRRGRRLWELHLLLSLLLHGTITRESWERPHHWVMLHEPTPAGAHTAYLNEGYMVGGGFLSQADDFSDPAGIPQLNVVPEGEYYARRGIGEDELDLPAGLDDFSDHFNAAEPARRDQLLRASYWLDAARRVWHTSKSLSYIAAINAVETLLSGRREGHTCPECGGFHDSPGPTARFRVFVEKYAGSEGVESRRALYDLRSTFVHGRGLHGLDLPRAWGALVPGDMEQWELHRIALAVARTAVRGWFLSDET